MDKNVEIKCFGVGFGDCIYIKLPNDIQILVDTGHKRAFIEVLDKLISEGRNIDYVFLTHSHGDHIGGMGQLIDNQELNIKGIFYWAPVDTKISKTNLEKIEKLREMSVHKERMIHCEHLDGDVIERINTIFEDYVKILYPISFNIHEYNTIDLNANSIVIDITVNDYHLLFMGDATKENEQVLIDECTKKGINLSKTIFWKIGHHASETASSDTFIDKILGSHFKKAICSCKDSWTNEPPSINKINEINRRLKNFNECIMFTGKESKRCDVTLKFTFDNEGNVLYVP